VLDKCPLKHELAKRPFVFWSLSIPAKVADSSQGLTLKYAYLRRNNASMEYKTCPNCNKKLDGFMATRHIVKENITSLLNDHRNESAKAYCTECAVPYLTEYNESARLEKARLQEIISANVKVIPIITAHSPLNWNYSVLDMVSAQTVTGIGLLSELSSSWSDFTGGQSGSLQEKLSQGELLCRNQLRYKAVMLGGNGVIAADVDYAEVGGAKGMLMVCMSGTAVKVFNPLEVLSIDFDRSEALKMRC
jgi:uncharacterized protein YbjQ (UPF0145 family)